MCGLRVWWSSTVNGIPYPNPRPLIQTLVIWPAVAWLPERQHSPPLPLAPSHFPRPHSNPTVTHIDGVPCHSPRLAVTLHIIKVRAMMIIISSAALVWLTESLQCPHIHFRDFYIQNVFLKRLTYIIYVEPRCRAEHNFPILLHDSWANKTSNDWCVDYLDNWCINHLICKNGKRE